MSDRGGYRSFYEALVDDPDFQALDPLTFKILFVLKMTLGAAGIGIARTLVLCEQVGCTPAELEAGLARLEQPKGDGGRGWIMRERNIVWIVNGLRFEPTLSPDNAKKHVPFVRRQLLPLGDRAIVRAFVEHYPEWFADARAKSDRAHERDTLSKGYPNGIETLSEGNRYTETETGTSDSDGRRATSDGERAPGPAGAAPLRTARDRFLNSFYGDATPERRRDVEGQLDACLSDRGAKLGQKARVRALNTAHLDLVLEEVLTDGVRDRDKAIVVVLRKLGDTSRPAPGRVTGEQLREQTRRDEALVRQYHRELNAAVEQWRKAHPQEYAAIVARAERERPEKSDLGDLMRQGIIQAAAGEAAGFPSEDAWLAQRQRRAS